MTILESILLLIIIYPLLVRIWTLNISIEGTYTLDQKGTNFGLMDSITMYLKGLILGDKSKTQIDKPPDKDIDKKCY